MVPGTVAPKVLSLGQEGQEQERGKHGSDALNGNIRCRVARGHAPSYGKCCCDSGVEVGSADVADCDDKDGDCEPECQRNAERTDVATHDPTRRDGPAAGEDQGERPDKLRRQAPRQGNRIRRRGGGVVERVRYSHGAIRRAAPARCKQAHAREIRSCLLGGADGEGFQPVPLSVSNAQNGLEALATKR